MDGILEEVFDFDYQLVELEVDELLVRRRRIREGVWGGQAVEMVEEDAPAEPACKCIFVKGFAEVTLLEAVKSQADRGFLMAEHVNEGVGMVRGVGDWLILTLVHIIVIVIRMDEEDIPG